MTAAVRIRDLFVARPTHDGHVAALRGLSLTVEAGSSVAVIGPSGVGKTTLLGVCSGTIRPTSGEATVLEVDVHAAPASVLATLRTGSVALVHQHFHRVLPPELTALEIVALPLRLAGASRTAATRAASELLEEVGLLDQRAARPRELSGGQQQRVAISAALVQRPGLVLADEPTGELDAAASERVLDVLLELGRRRHATLFVATHDETVSRRVDRVLQLRDGRLSAEGLEAPAVVIDEQGWLRLPSGLRPLAGSRVDLRADDGVIRLVPRDRTERAPAPTPLAPPRSARTGAAVRATGIGKSFGRERVLAGVNLAPPPGVLHVIAGPSGSGKTTLLDILAGLIAPDVGHVEIDGARLDAFDPEASARWRRHTVGYVGQHTHLLTWMTLRENLALVNTIRDVTDPDDWTDTLGLTALLDRPANALSGGQRRLAAIARALAGRPSLLLADEPTAHLDRDAARTIIETLQTLASSGLTIIAATHDAELIAAAASRTNLVAPVSAVGTGP